ncbi:MAG: zinc ribbon domain-containing protein, partial [Propionibacteriaceae bacterium]|nr:zinc ribbon domain-containing protein [Propionibacteriaceae bacterium]
MPTYQYRCKDCDSELEVVQKFTDDALTECPTCEGGQLRKVFNAVGVVFKGSGFYRTDSRTKDKSGTAGSGSSSGSDGKAASDSASGASTSGTSSSGDGGSAGGSNTGGSRT